MLTGNYAAVWSDSRAGDPLKTAAERDMQETQRDGVIVQPSAHAICRAPGRPQGEKQHPFGPESTGQGTWSIGVVEEGEPKGIWAASTPGRGESGHIPAPLLLARGPACPAPLRGALLENKRGPGQKHSAPPALRCPVPPSRTLAQNSPFRPLHSDPAGRSLPVWRWAVQLGRCGWCRPQLGMAR